MRNDQQDLKKILKYFFRILIGRPLRIITKPPRVLLEQILLWEKDVWDFPQIEISSENSLEKLKKNNELEGVLSFLRSNESKTPALISFVSPMRFKNNSKEHSPEIFLNSLIQDTSDLDRIEIIIAIDTDDNIEHFVKLKQKYRSKIKNFRVYICEEKFGYGKLHLYDHFLYQYISPSSRMIADFSDDCKVVLPKWDEYILEIDSKFKDNIYFIHTNNFRIEKYVGKFNGSIAKMIWSEQVIAPASYFPIVSRKVMEIASKCLETLNAETRKNWAPLANSTFYDCYIDIISHLVKEKFPDRIIYDDIINIEPQSYSDKRKNVIHFGPEMSKLCHKKSGITPNEAAFLIMLEPATQDHLKLIANRIISEINGPSSKA